ncbi:N-substituted formamide deformylase [Diplonema papillatum]|nr:N-substituted formamide deformylase [Diplonema papillatum]
MACCVTEAAKPVAMEELDVFVAKRIITLNEGWPECTAVAVGNGRVVSVGTLDSLQPWLKGKKHTVHQTFKDKVIVPGFIDPHMHPLLGGMALSLPCLSYYNQPSPYGKDHDGLKTVQQVKDKLRAILDEHKSDANHSDPVLCWGYDQVAMGGHIDKDFFEFLDEFNQEHYRRPVVIWDASMHYVYCNQKCIDWCQIDVAACKDKGEGAILRTNAAGVEEALGRFLGNHAAGLVLSKTLPIVRSKEHFMYKAVKRIIDLSARNGLTCISELGLGLVSLSDEMQLYDAAFHAKDLPVRCVTVVLADAAVGKHKGNVDEAIEWIRSLQNGGAPFTGKLVCNGVKFFTDDAFVGLTMQMCGCPGYVDGHAGIWLSDPGEPYLKRVLPFWKAGLQIHVHSNGDCGQDATIQLLADLQRACPRFDHRFTFEHFGMSTVAQVKKVKALGAVASVNIYYPYLRGELNEAHLGSERAHMASRLGTLTRHGVPAAVHTDTPIAPPCPLEEMWIAVNRFGQSGRVLAPDERVSVEQALKMVTIEAAFILGMDHVMGSIETGKYADFTILEQDPFEVRPEDLRTIPVWGTVVGGKVFQRKTKDGEQLGKL